MPKQITFIEKQCPRCKSIMSIKKLGTWGYYCDKCEFWWGTYEPYPIEKEIENKKE